MLPSRTEQFAGVCLYMYLVRQIIYPTVDRRSSKRLRSYTVTILLVFALCFASASPMSTGAYPGFKEGVC